MRPLILRYYCVGCLLQWGRTWPGPKTPSYESLPCPLDDPGEGMLVVADSFFPRPLFLVSSLSHQSPAARIVEGLSDRTFLLSIYIDLCLLESTRLPESPTSWLCQLPVLRGSRRSRAHDAPSHASLHRRKEHSIPLVLTARSFVRDKLTSGTGSVKLPKLHGRASCGLSILICVRYLRSRSGPSREYQCFDLLDT